MKKLIIAVSVFLVLCVFVSATLQADIMSWEDRQKLTLNTQLELEADEGGWVDTQSISPNTNTPLIDESTVPEDNNTTSIIDDIADILENVIDILWSNCTNESQ